MNMLDKIMGKSPSTQESDNQNPAETAEEGAEGQTLSQEDGDKKVSDPYADWTKDDFIKEMSESRKEAAKARVEKKELEKQFSEELDKKLKAVEEKFTPYIEKSVELLKQKEKDEDAKKTAEERLADREAKLEKLQEEIRTVTDSYRAEKVELQSKLEKAMTTVDAYEGHVKKQLDKEMETIPSDKKYLADLIIKSSGNDVAEALATIRQAKNDNVFGNKTVKVFNATPSAKDGARYTAASTQDTNTPKSSQAVLEEGITEWKKAQKKRLGLE